MFGLGEAGLPSRSVIALDKAVHFLVSTSYRDLIKVGSCVLCVCVLAWLLFKRECSQL